MFDSPKPPKVGSGPATLEMLDERQNWLEDVATLERDLGFVTRIMLSSLISELARKGVIDSDRIIAYLQASKPDLENETQRLYLSRVIDDLLAQLSELTPGSAPDESLH